MPAEWVLSLHHQLPELPPEDIQSFLSLEAERGFPSSPEQLQLALSNHRTPTAAYATQLAVSRDQLDRLEAVLAAAQLRPVHLALGIAALPEALGSEGRGNLTVLVGEAGVTLLVAAGGGIVALRTLDNVIESEGSERRVLADVVARELRITLANLTEDLRGELRQVRIVGTGSLTEQLVRELETHLRGWGLEVRRLSTANGIEHGVKMLGEAPFGVTLSLAVEQLSERPSQINFLPPKPTFWQQLSTRYSGRRLVYGGATAGAVATIVCGLFLVQTVQLAGLRSDWNTMEAKVRELDELQGRIRTFRPWYDPNLTSLGILQRVTEAFPEEGTVTAKIVEIRHQSAVNVSGTTRDNAALLKTLDQLRAAPEVGDVKVETISGKSPMQFTFNFQWGVRP